MESHKTHENLDFLCNAEMIRNFFKDSLESIEMSLNFTAIMYNLYKNIFLTF